MLSNVIHVEVGVSTRHKLLQGVVNELVLLLQRVSSAKRKPYGMYTCRRRLTAMCVGQE